MRHKEKERERERERMRHKEKEFDTCKAWVAQLVLNKSFRGGKLHYFLGYFSYIS